MTQQTYWSIFKLNLSRMPWRDYIAGMFVPLIVLQFLSVHSFPLLSVYITLAWLLLAIAVIYILDRVISLFPIITLIVTVTSVAGHMLAPKYPVFVLVPSLNAMIIGLIFIGSMLRPRPFIMSLIGKETINRTEAKFGKSKYFYKAWFDINIIWGMFYIIQGVIISYLMVLNMELGNVLNIIFSWPSVLVLLYISVDYPRRYWEKHWEQMRVEIEAAEEYEKEHHPGRLV